MVTNPIQSNPIQWKLNIADYHFGPDTAKIQRLPAFTLSDQDKEHNTIQQNEFISSIIN